MPKIPRIIATIDCETDPFLHGRIPLPFLWDYWDGQKHVTIADTKEFVNYLSTLPPCIIYAHNGGKFDYHMPGFLNALEPFSKIMMINGRLAKFKIGNCEFRDSCNILPIALAAYKKEEIDYAKFEKGVREKHLPEITKYLHKDTEYLRELVVKFRENYGDGLTLAGSAMKFWQARSGIEAPRSTAGFYHDVSRFYYGGRVECFSKGLLNEPFSMIDINSAYPFAMLHNHPFSTEYSQVKPHKDDEICQQSLYCVKAISRGAFPFREENGKLTFPNDSTVREYKITGWELFTALKLGATDVLDICYRLDFAETINFDKYIKYFYDMKKNSAKESADYIFAKLFMNSLYGKFGANPEEYCNYEIIPTHFIEAAKADGKDFAGELGKWAVTKEPLLPEQQRFYNVATAASITGFVRAYLFKHIHSINAHGGRVHYCDTDSIAFNGKPSVVRFGKELGEWAHEGDFVGGGIGGKKLYVFDRGESAKPEKRYKFGCKGVRLSPLEILEVCKGQTVTYKRDAPSYGIRTKKNDAGVIISTPSFVTRNVTQTA